MPEPLIEFDIEAHELQELIDRLPGRVKNLKPAFKNIGEYMVKERESWFREERDPDGRPWQKLKVRTYYSLFKNKKRYTQKGKLTAGFTRFLGSKKILTQDNHLRRTVYKAESDQVKISPDQQAKDYAAIHQFGGLAGRDRKAKIPARPHLGVNRKNEAEIVRIIKDYLMGEFA
nr:phage virion morphogenesis protein [uncultured Desulfobacter sp.]